MVETISNLQLSGLKFKLHRGQSLRDIIDSSVGTRFYPHPGSENHTLLNLEKLRGPTHHQANFCEDPNKK